MDTKWFLGSFRSRLFITAVLLSVSHAAELYIKEFPVNELEQPISLPISTPAPIPDYKFEGDVSPNVTIGDDTELASIWAM